MKRIRSSNGSPSNIEKVSLTNVDSLSLSTDATDLPGSIESGEIVVSGSVYAPSSNSSYSGIESLSMRRVVTRGARGIDQSGQSE